MTLGPDELFDAVRAGDRVLVRRVLEACPAAATARDGDGATALHYATESGHREIVQALLDAGADINARDGRFHATPAGWAIEYLRQRGALLGIEIEDAGLAIAKDDADLVLRYLTRFPVLRDAVAKDGTPLKDRAMASGSRDIRRLFEAGRRVDDREDRNG